MRQVASILFAIICVMASSSAFSKAILQITPDSTIPITISPIGNSSLIYTVTNNTQDKPVNNLTIDPYYNLTGNPLSLTIANNNCAGQTLQVGQSCTFQLNIQGTGQPTNVMLSPKVCPYGGAVCSTAIESNRTNVVVETNSPILITIGSDFLNRANVILAQSLDGGSHWAFQPISGLPTLTQFEGLDASCTGSGVTAFCVAVGVDTDNKAVLIQSNNGGQTWNFITVPDPTGAQLLASACVDGGTTCIAVGGDNGFVAPPVINESTDGGRTWELKTIPNDPTNGQFSAANCTGNGATSICSAIGLSFIGGDPLLAQSIGNGSWSFRSVPGVGAGDEWLGISCTGSETTAMCAAVGIANPVLPLLAQSINGTTNWQVVTSITGLPATSGIFRAISCTGSGATAICVAAGFFNLGAPIIAQTTNGGGNWALQTIPGLPATGSLEHVSCSGSGATAICVAVGQDTVTGAPLLLQSNGGGSWNIVSVPSMPVLGILHGVNCMGSGTTAICVAGGQDTTAGGANTPAFLVQTNNGGTTWRVITVPGTPANSSFIGTGGSGGSQLANKPYGARKALEKILYQ